MQAGGSLRGLSRKGVTSAWADWVGAHRRAVRPHSSPNNFILYILQVSYVPILNEHLIDCLFAVVNNI